MAEIAAEESVTVEFVLNGQPVRGRAEPRLLLTDFLQHEIGAIGTHAGCEHGVCGACTVLVDGEPARACLTFAVQVEGREVRTVEGLAAADGSLNALQAAFARNFALQCGFCTPGILMSATAFLAANPTPTRAEVIDMLGGHICRCTGYYPIVAAIMEVADGTAPSRKE